MLRGVTSFLETLDQKAEKLAETAERQREEQEEEEEILKTQQSSAVLGGNAGGGGYAPRRTASDRLSTKGTPHPETASNASAGGRSANTPLRSLAQPVPLSFPHGPDREAGSSGSSHPASHNGDNDGSSGSEDRDSSAEGHYSKEEGHRGDRQGGHHSRPAHRDRTAASALPAFVFSSDVSVDTLKLQYTNLQNELVHRKEKLEETRTRLMECEAARAGLEVRCTKAEESAESWQRQAQLHKEGAATVRDQLQRKENEVHVLQEAQQDLLNELAEYRESSRRLVEAKDKEIDALRAMRQRGGTGTAAGGVDGAGGVSAEQAHELEEQLRALEAKLAGEENELERWKRECAAAKRDVSHAQDERRQLEQQVDSLFLDIRAAQESLQGEVAAHAETKASLRELQSALNDARFGRASNADGAFGASSMRGGAGGPSSAGGAMDETSAGLMAAQLAASQDELANLQQRCQQLSFQLMERQTELDASTREVADWKARYDNLARRVGDEEVAAAAGYGNPATAVPLLHYAGLPGTGAAGSAGSSGHGVGGGGGKGLGGATTRVQFHGKGGGSGGSAVPATELRRTPAMLQLTRRGKVGRVLVEVLCRVDEVALQLGRLLRIHATLRVCLACYLICLQVWVIVVIWMNLSFDEVRRKKAVYGPAPDALE